MRKKEIRGESEEWQVQPREMASPSPTTLSGRHEEVPREWQVGTESSHFVLCRSRETLRNALETVLSCSNRIGAGGG